MMLLILQLTWHSFVSTKKIALITGANKGIGLETARQLAKQGVTVLAGARDEAKVDQAAAALRKEGLDVHGVVIDVNLIRFPPGTLSKPESGFRKPERHTRNREVNCGERFVSRNSPDARSMLIYVIRCSYSA